MQSVQYQTSGLCIHLYLKITFCDKALEGNRSEIPPKDYCILIMPQSSQEYLNQALEGFKKELRICLEYTPFAGKPDLRFEKH